MKDLINGQPEQDIDHCGNCIHSADSLEICVLRTCKYAIGELIDCYEPKQLKQPWIPCSERLPKKDDAISRKAVLKLLATMPPEDAITKAMLIQSVKQMDVAQPERKKPVFKTGESVYHVSYADGTGRFKKNKWADWTCPDCGWIVGEQYIPRRHNQQKCNYCAKCGCAIDWSDADMRGEQDE